MSEITPGPATLPQEPSLGAARRARLMRLPLKQILFVCITFILAGFSRSAELFALGIAAWAGYFALSFIGRIKRRVEEKQAAAAGRE